MYTFLVFKSPVDYVPDPPKPETRIRKHPRRPLLEPFSKGALKVTHLANPAPFWMLFWASSTQAFASLKTERFHWRPAGALGLRVYGGLGFRGLGFIGV